jgi:ATP synthase protein I
MKEDDRKLFRMLGVLSTVGMVLVFSTMIGLYVGIKIDQWLNTSPWFTAIFFLMGLFAGFKNLFKYAKRSGERLDEKEDKNP